MRLPWPFRRTPAGLPAAAPPDATAEPALPPPPRAEWRALPPLVETMGEPPLIAPPRPFARELAVNNAPAAALSTLGHERSLAAPAGLVVGLSRPVETSPSTGSSLYLHRPQGGHASVQVAGTASAPPAIVPAPELPGPRRLSAAKLPPVANRRPLASLAGEDLVRLPLTAPVGLLGQSAERRGPGSAAPPAPGSTPAAPESTPAPAPSPAARAGLGLTSVSPRAAEPAAGSRLTLGQSRRARLGQPLPALPRRDTQRALLEPSKSSQPAAMPLAAGQPAASLGRPASEPSSPPASPFSAARQAAVAPASLPALPALRVREVPLPATRPADRLSTAARATSPAPAAASAGQRARRLQVPLTSARPLRARVQRAPLSAAPTDDRPAPPPAGRLSGGSADGPVLVHRGPEASESTASLQARAFTHGGEIFLPASHGPLNAGPARSLLAHELVHVAQQRMLGAELPGEDTPHGRQLEAQARAAEMGDSTPLVLAAGASRSVPASDGATQSGPMRAPQAGIAEPAPEGAPGPPGIDEKTVVQFSTVQRAAEAPAAGEWPTLAAASRSEQDLEELAGQLYGRIELRLRRELLVGRERAGMVFDVR